MRRMRQYVIKQAKDRSPVATADCTPLLKRYKNGNFPGKTVILKTDPAKMLKRWARQGWQYRPLCDVEAGFTVYWLWNGGFPEMAEYFKHRVVGFEVLPGESSKEI